MPKQDYPTFLSPAWSSYLAPARKKNHGCHGILDNLQPLRDVLISCWLGIARTTLFTMKLFALFIFFACVLYTCSASALFPPEMDLEDSEELADVSHLLGQEHIRAIRSSDEDPIQRRMVKRKRKRLPQAQPGVKVTKVLRRKIDSKPLKVISTTFSNETSLESGLERERNGRFFSLFTVVRFNNDACPTNSGENGTCYTASDCSNRGGSNDGTCASGFGVCCFFRFGCGATTSDNGTYFVNPPTTERICNLMVNRMNNDICQIRLDFTTFDITDPNAKGECNTDFFLVTGGSSVPQLCGVNTGQHVIYSITSDSGPTQLSMVMDPTITPSSSRQWNIRVLQYECSSRVLAPVGCLQYYMSASGLIQSFNYKTDVRSNSEPNHLANLNYAICIRVDNGYCGIRYSQPRSDPFSFTISRDASTTILAFPLPSTGVKYGDADCQSDYIIIPGGSEDGKSSLFARDRFCGITLGSCAGTTPTATTCMATTGAVTTYSKPFIVQVITDLDEGVPVIDKANRGFRLNYNQQPCLRG